GYQSKAFSWVNLYTPFNTQETENLKTELYAVNHRVSLGNEGDHFQAGIYHRINRDHYSIPLFVFDNFHTNRVTGAAFDGRVTLAEPLALRYQAGVIADSIKSNALVVGPTNGRYDDRTQFYAGLFADHTTELSDTRSLVLTVGTNFDESNRAGAEFSPTAALTLHQSAGGLRRLYASYTESTQLPTYSALNNSTHPGLFAGNRDLARAPQPPGTRTARDTVAAAAHGASGGQPINTARPHPTPVAPQVQTAPQASSAATETWHNGTTRTPRQTAARPTVSVLTNKASR